jgi:hypothetical protein
MPIQRTPSPSELSLITSAAAHLADALQHPRELLSVARAIGMLETLERATNPRRVRFGQPERRVRAVGGWPYPLLLMLAAELEAIYEIRDRLLVKWGLEPLCDGNGTLTISQPSSDWPPLPDSAEIQRLALAVQRLNIVLRAALEGDGGGAQPPKRKRGRPAGTGDTDPHVGTPKESTQTFFPQGAHFDALCEVSAIVKGATRTVILVDSYITEDTLKLLSGKSLAVSVRILTKNCKPNVELAAGKFNQQYGGLSIRTSDSFHDRFLVIDDREYYHLGHSVKDIGATACMLTQVTDANEIDKLHAEFQRVWDVARSCVGERITA